MIRLLLACVASCALALPASSAAAGGGTPALPYGERPMELPPAGAAARADAGAQSAWLVGARPTAEAGRIARRHGARALRTGGVFRVPRTRARALAASLRAARLLTYAEPDSRLERRSSFEARPADWARGPVVAQGLMSPAPGSASVAIIDDRIDPTHPDVGPQTRNLNSQPSAVLDDHGTAVASAASGAANGTGVLGIFPSVRLLNYAIPLDFGCSEIADGVSAAAQADATIINLSVGGTEDCFTMFRAVQRAFGAGSLVVAAAGNEFQEGNPTTYPAAYPHVLSVAALNRQFRSADFSNENTAIDVAAPGVEVPVAVPLAFDTSDGARDGITELDGTSFASPIVAGVAAWVAAARPRATPGQVSDLLRRSARDIPPRGYDNGTGLGLVDLRAALAAPTPREDPLEPNDGFSFVDGTVFRGPARLIWRGTGSGRLRATADSVEDPIDVYRFRVPARGRVNVLVSPNSGDPDLRVFTRRARGISDDDRGLVGRSLRFSGRTDAVSVANRSRRAQVFYAVVDAATAEGFRSTSYRIRFQRQRFR